MYASIAILSALAAAVSGQSLSDAISGESDLSTLATYLQNSGLLDTVADLDGITIFAPTNSAFEEALQELGLIDNDDEDDVDVDDNSDSVPQVLQNILQYHVVPGGAYLSTDLLEYPGNFLPTSYNDLVVNPYYGDVEGSGVYSAEKRLSTIGQADLEYDNGVIHIIDKVMLPPTPANETALDMGFLYFAGAVDTLDLTADVVTADQVTLFIPMDSAFAEVGGAIPDLSTSELNTLIQYHVVVGDVAYSLNISDGSSFETLSGDDLDFTVDESDGAVYVNNARIITPNILLENGVAHLIDQVLNPSDEYEYDLGDDGEGVPAFEDVENAEVPALTSGLPSPTNPFEPSMTFSAVSGAADVKSQGIFAGLFGIVALAAFVM